MYQHFLLFTHCQFVIITLFVNRDSHLLRHHIPHSPCRNQNYNQGCRKCNTRPKFWSENYICRSWVIIFIIYHLYLISLNDVVSFDALYHKSDKLFIYFSFSPLQKTLMSVMPFSVYSHMTKFQSISHSLLKWNLSLLLLDQ